MNQLSRRLFLKASSVAPLALKEAAAQQVAKQAGLLDVVGTMASGPPPLAPSPDRGLKLLGLAKAGMLPDWYEREMRRNARADARVLDPDLASLRSVSVAAKISIQAERNYQRRMANLVQNLLDNDAAARFWGLFGN